MSVISFLLLSIPLIECATIWLSFLPLMDTFLAILYKSAFLNKSLCGNAFSFLWGKYLELVLLSNMVTYVINFIRTARPFPKVAVAFCTTPSNI